MINLLETMLKDEKEEAKEAYQSYGAKWDSISGLYNLAIHFDPLQQRQTLMFDSEVEMRPGLKYKDFYAALNKAALACDINPADITQIHEEIRAGNIALKADLEEALGRIYLNLRLFEGYTMKELTGHTSPKGGKGDLRGWREILSN